MRPLRNLLNELVERRLWPVALLLLVALVAVPLLLAKPASSPDDATSSAPPPAAAQAAAAAVRRAPAEVPPGGEAVVAVAQADQPDAPLRGSKKNPFRQQHVSPEPNLSGSSTATSAGTSNGTGETGSGDTGSGGTVTQPPVRMYWYPSIDVRFGHAGRKLSLIEDFPPLAALPRAQKPVVIFLGVRRRDHETAGFLVSTDVRVQGTYRSACFPDADPCQVIAMRRGDVVFFDYTEVDGSVVQYELELLNLTRRVTDSPARADAAYARSSRLARRALRHAARRASARHAPAHGARVATAVTGTTPRAPALEPLP
jgi:hypothetical protein